VLKLRKKKSNAIFWFSATGRKRPTIFTKTLVQFCQVFKPKVTALILSTKTCLCTATCLWSLEIPHIHIARTFQASWGSLQVLRLVALKNHTLMRREWNISNHGCKKILRYLILTQESKSSELGWDLCPLIILRSSVLWSTSLTLFLMLGMGPKGFSL